MSIEQQLTDGHNAKEVLQNPAFLQAFEAIEKEVIDTWTSSPARDAEGREKCWTYLHLLRKVQQHLISTMETGKLAELELIHKQSLLDRVKNYLA